MASDGGRRTIGRYGGREMAALGFLGGLTIGVVLWSQQLHRSKHDLSARTRYGDSPPSATCEGGRA